MANYKQTLNWASDVPLDTTTRALMGATTFDALNRPVTIRTPEGTLTSFAYNHTGLAKSLRTIMRGVENRTVSVESVEYNANGQRTLFLYGNAVQTMWEYDPLTFRLKRTKTTRSKAVFPDDYPSPAISG